MTITKLPVNFKDDIIDTTINDKRRYYIEDNPDGTKSLDDATTYTQIGSNFGAEQINKTNGTINQLIDATEEMEQTVKTVSEKSFILLNKGIIEFGNNEAIIGDERITEDSLADVYFTTETFNTADSAVITVETFTGYVKLMAGRTPEGIIRATIIIRVV